MTATATLIRAGLADCKTHADCVVTIVLLNNGNIVYHHDNKKTKQPIAEQVESFDSIVSAGEKFSELSDDMYMILSC
jgi:hypothetical protein